jgi:hypothetical protein
MAGKVIKMAGGIKVWKSTNGGELKRTDKLLNSLPKNKY